MECSTVGCTSHPEFYCPNHCRRLCAKCSFSAHDSCRTQQLVRPTHLDAALAVVTRQLETMSHQAQVMRMSDIVEGFDQKLQEYSKELEVLQTQVQNAIAIDKYSEYDGCMLQIQK